MTGAELKRLRLRLELSRTELGEIMGRSYDMVTSWEIGRNPVPVYARVIVVGLLIERMQGRVSMQSLIKHLHEYEKTALKGDIENNC